MKCEIVKAAERLGGSILIASLVLVVGLRWGRHEPSTAPALVPAPAPVSVALPSVDTQVMRAGGELTEETSTHTENFCASPDADRVPIVDANPDGSTTASCLDPPSEEQIWTKFVDSRRGAAHELEIQRTNVRFMIEKIGEKVDPCKVYPLAGACELIHCHYKCTVCFDELSTSDAPFPVNHRKTRVEVVFLEKDHLRRCGGASKSTNPD
jgi:hypothetical protein